MFGIIANFEILENQKYIKQIIDFLDEYNIKCTIATVKQDWFGNYVYSLPTNIDYIIALGGDGTILQSSQNAIKSDIPIIGFNTGTLGFLAEYNINDYKAVLKNIIDKKYSIDTRSTIDVFKDGKLIDKCLNDAVISRDGFSRIVSVEILVDNVAVNKYRGDGVIICTPTGSTGYNLSLNGPIVSTKSKNIIVTPIASHSLLSRSMVLSDTEEVKINILESRKTQEKEAILTCDGRRNIDLHSGESLLVKTANQTVKLLKLQDSNIFSICQQKLC